MTLLGASVSNRWLGTKPPSLSDSNPTGLYDPKTACGLLCLEESKRTLENRQRVLDALSGWTQDPNAWMRRRRIQPNVREIEIQRNEYSAFGTTRIEHFDVWIATKMLICSSFSVVARGQQEGFCVARKILV